MKKIVLVVLLFSMFGTGGFAQSKRDSLKLQKKMWVSGAGFPFYKPTTSAGVGGAVLISFQADQNDSVSFRSYIPLSLLVSIRGQLALTSGLNLFLNENKMKLIVDMDVDYGIANYFGTTDNLKAPEIGDTTTHYTQVSFDPEFHLNFRIAENLYVGPYLDVTYKYLYDIAPDVYQQMKPLHDKKHQIFNLGIGAGLEYSSIDNPTFPYRGIQANMRMVYNNELLSSNIGSFGLWFDYRQYVRLFKRRTVLAWRLNSNNVIGSKENLFLLLPSIEARGLMDGYYYAPSTGVASIELRHMFASNEYYQKGKFWSRFGGTLWANAGAYGNNLFAWDDFVYSAGLGLRCEVQPYKNVRFDIGQQIGGYNKIVFYFGFTEYF